MPSERFAPSLRLQDELHLLRDSLGAVDSHYESILDHLQHELGASNGKIAASSATLTGYDRQVDVLYSRQARVFPAARTSRWRVILVQADNISATAVRGDCPTRCDA